MSPEILVPGPILESVHTALDEVFTVHRLWEADDRRAKLAEIGSRIQGIATMGKCDAALMEACPNLQIVSSFGVGYDGVNVAHAKTKNIRVSNTPDVLNDAVAEMTFALMISLCRKVPQAERYMKAGCWVAEGDYAFTGELTGATVGVLGLGRIGKEFAARCQAFKMRVVYHGRNEQAYLPYTYYGDLEAMARDVDWLVCIAPGGAGTKGIISRKVLEALGSKGALVSIGRGTSIDQAAMVEMLQSGTLGGAALDVFEDEPNVPEELFDLDSVVLSPHQGSATHKTRWAMGDLVVRNLKAHFAGEPLISPVV
ncbi:MAG: 2-hydroxyacid dehydrogenase [Pseudomonadota bacterium]